MKSLRVIILAVLVASTVSASAQTLSLFSPLGNTCVLYDSRAGDAPPLAGGSTVYLLVRGTCGISADATAVAVNAIAIPDAGGLLRIFDSGLVASSVFGVMNYASGVTSRESFPVRLCPDPLECSAVDLGIHVSGTTHVVLVAQGYYSPYSPPPASLTALDLIPGLSEEGKRDLARGGFSAPASVFLGWSHYRLPPLTVKDWKAVDRWCVHEQQLGRR